nr:lymphoid-restricted membrane protein-like [Penaeus vannamei]
MVKLNVVSAAFLLLIIRFSAVAESDETRSPQQEDADAPGYASDDDSIKKKVWGAVQQEWRVSRALEVLLLHVENVKRLYERDHQELEEMRKLLAEYQIDMPNSSGNASNSNTQSNSDNPTPGVRLRTFSLAVGGKQQSQETRRISFTTGTTHAALSAFLGTKSSKRRASLMPIYAHSKRAKLP